MLKEKQQKKFYMHLCRSEENMDLTIPNKNDKDKQLEFLKEALREVKAKVEDLPRDKAAWDDVEYRWQQNSSVSERLDSITDFIDKRLVDVSY